LKQENLPPVSSSASDSMLNVYPEHDSDGLPMYRNRPVNGYNSNNSFLPQFTFFGATTEKNNSSSGRDDKDICSEKKSKRDGFFWT